MYAICGVGKWGSHLLDEFSKRVSIKSFCCNTDATATKIQSKYPKIVRASLDEICEDEEVTDVIVSVPINHLSFYSKKLLKAKKNLFLEKPAGKSTAEIEELISSQNKEKVQVDYKFLFHTQVTDLADAISNGLKIVRFSISWHKYGSFGNDVRLNLLSHDISLIKFLFPNENFYMEYSHLKEDSLHINCFSDAVRGKIYIDRGVLLSKKYHRLILEDAASNIHRIDLYSEPVLEKSIENFISQEPKTNTEIGLVFANSVIKTLEEIRK